jgi:sensor histidine kinase regulating citrate/malate metabolism
VNAVESSLDASAAEEVVVNWGTTDVCHWISVHDRGLGLPPSPQGIWSFGGSTKRDHLGAGLNMIFQAARSLGAEVEISTEGNTTRFFIEWPRHALERVE